VPWSRYAKTVFKSGFSSKLRSIWYIKHSILIFFHFIYPVMHYGYKRKLTTFDKFPIPDLNSPSNCSYFDITYMLLWWNQIMSSSSPGVNIAIAGAIKQVWKNCVQIWILLKNPVNLIYRTSHLDNIKFPTAGCSGVFCVLQPN
jgi:hypothetical protein